mmetsp:Transcript_14498/g.21337  ORF Transcript_14498/g.21337 Transcript_14498/m.21337 type:complete len:246 (-) Transcript_14498:444-1181(-)
MKLSTGIPWMNVSTSTFSLTMFWIGCGKKMSWSSSKFSVRRQRFVPSWLRSIWSISTFSNSSMVSRKLRYFSLGNSSMKLAKLFMMSMSASTLSLILGCSTLTATCVPASTFFRPFSSLFSSPAFSSSSSSPLPGAGMIFCGLLRVPLYTWAMQPLPMGRCSSMCRNFSQSPKAAFNSLEVCFHPCGLVLSCSLTRRFVRAAGNRSSRVLAHWASFIKVGPLFSIAQSKYDHIISSTFGIIVLSP